MPASAPSPHACASTDYPASLSHFCQHVLPQHTAYQNNYRASHGRALATNYPLCVQLLGQHCFTKLADVYVAHYPSAAWDINHYGEDFAEFVQAQQHSSRQDIDWLLISAVARLERALIEAYYDFQSPANSTLYCPVPQTLLPALAAVHPYLRLEAELSEHPNLQLEQASSKPFHLRLIQIRGQG